MLSNISRGDVDKEKIHLEGNRFRGKSKGVKCLQENVSREESVKGENVKGEMSVIKRKYLEGNMSKGESVKGGNCPALMRQVLILYQ